MLCRDEPGPRLGLVQAQELVARRRGWAALRRGTDLRLLNGQVPSWPEAADATRLGQALAQTMNVPFHFQNADTPDIDQLRWWDTLS